MALLGMHLWPAPCGGDELPLISHIQVVSDAEERTPQLLEALALEVGQPFDRTRLRQRVLTAFAVGDMERLRVAAEADQSGLAVRVEASYSPRLAAIEIDTGERRWRRRIRSWLGLSTGGAVAVGEIEAAVRRVARNLRGRGFARARVEPFLDYDRASNQVTLTVAAELGEPDRLAAIEIAGLPPTVGQLKAQRSIELDTRIGERRLEKLRNRVEAELRRLGYWEAEVLGTERHGQGSAVTIVVKVDAGHHYELAISGPAEVEKLARKALPNPVDEDIHPAQTERLAERLREELQRQGRLLANASIVLAAEGRQRRLEVELEPDVERRVTRIEFLGAVSLSREELEAAVSVRTGKLGGWRRRELTEASLELDRIALEAAYRLRGFAEVRIEPPQIAADGADGAQVTFTIDEGRTFTIDEGRRWLLTEVRRDGFPVEAVALLEDQESPIIVGAAWDQRQVEPERRRLELSLANAGYPDGRVTAEVDTSEPGSARVSFVADPGPFVRLGEIVIAGLKTVRPSVVERALGDAGVRSGAPYSLAAILDAQRRLYELGVFRQVELVPIPGQERRVIRGLVVRCQEGSHRSYLLGAGWDTTDRLRATFGWSHLNLFGGDHALSLEARVSERSQRYQISLREHHLPLLGEPGAMVAYRTEEEFATYSQRRHGLWIEVGDRRRRRFRRWLRYEYQIVRPDAPPEVLSDLERYDQESQIASITPSLEWDTRNDPLRPTRGGLLAISAEYAFPAFRADAQFLKGQLDLSLYRQLLGGTGALGLRLGAIRPIASSDAEPVNLQVPLSVRFFAGGRASHRAFDTDELGVPGQTLDDDGKAIGGNALALLSLEYERALRGALSGVLFVDLGNVWAEPSTVSRDDIRWGVGLGVRYETPAGPLRLEYGLKLDREPDEPKGELFLSFGVPF
jgi:outer membrane protein assembly complex protein YaeT